ncbi:endonuclease/exonuclease/phosphatase family protein [Sphingobacterium sp. JB170]|uniref:endonuclease/exonuclease/phosphatase family protein n=1 Tax=Sphingobacterium sp. JB170 TaxID=1434842 RepID=UPI00097E8754|nr:endonuclease/exonuclease/phosphatase family protein [Sphingobacterium sp. JB170]SJN18417.1 endonuclease/exonuclease/phosphatase family protein [Sphingobacterium sp. JB170]
MNVFIKIGITFLISILLLSCKSKEAIAPDEPFEEKPIKIMSFNICNDNAGAPEGYSWFGRRDDVIKLLQKHQPDILCAQEDLVQQGDYMTQAMGWTRTGMGFNPPSGGAFNGVYFNEDRFTKIQSGMFWLSETPEKYSKGWDAQAVRTCNWVIMKDKHSREEIAIFNTHLDHLGNNARIQSAKLILEKIQEIGQGRPTVLTGDFNSPRNSSPYQILAEAMGDSRLISETSPRGPIPTIVSTGTGSLTSEADYIFLKGFNVSKYQAIDDKRENGLYFSDHIPIKATLTLN